MTVVWVVAMLVVAAAATGVVLTRDPLRQSVVAGVFGVTLAVLFLLLRAPDVALSILVVSAIAVPAMVLFTVVKLQQGR